LIERKINLLLIGKGDWSLKLQKIFGNKEFNIICKIVGAREFIESRDLEVVNNKIIWICTNTDLQLEILYKLRNLTNKLILEKPLFTNLSQLQKFTKIVEESTLSLYFSCPWKYSKIWEFSKKTMMQNIYPLNIQTQRYGTALRKYAKPPQDWLAHDIYLVQDLFISTNFRLIERETIWIEDTKEAIVNLKMPDGSKCSIIGGYANSAARWANWSVYFSDNSKMEIDFLYGETRIYNNAEVDLPEQIVSITENHPVVEMLANYATNAPMIPIKNHISWQSLLV